MYNQFATMDGDIFIDTPASTRELKRFSRQLSIEAHTFVLPHEKGIRLVRALAKEILDEVILPSIHQLR